MTGKLKLATACVAAALLATGVHGLLSAGAKVGSPSDPEIKHVFVIVLENEDADSTFGPSTEIPYLADSLKSEGAYIPNYYGTAHESLSNYIAMISGQGPTIENQADCEGYHDIAPATSTPYDQFPGQVSGSGCVYPAGTTQTVANLLEDSGYTWKGYMEDMAAKAPNEPATCRHPDLNSQDDTQTAEVGDQYAARHNPFVYFHSIINFPTCDKNDVDLNQLGPDLADKDKTPNYALIVPNLCHDGHDTPCVDGEPGGMVSANAWLQDNVPPILNSPAFQDHGLLIVTFDEAEGLPPDGDASSCCNEPTGPNTPNNGGPIPGGGGGKVGAVALSPCITPGTTDNTPYNHYSLLASVENFFGLPKLGYSGQDGLDTFDSSVFSNPDCSGDTEPPDQDGDGVSDAADNCPGIGNPAQTDTDNDGIGDACDEDSGPPECSGDADCDGVDDGADNCPGVANPDQSDTDKDGIGDLCDNHDDSGGAGRPAPSSSSPGHPGGSAVSVGEASSSKSCKKTKGKHGHKKKRCKKK